MNLVDSATKGLGNAFQYVLIGVVGSIAYLSFGIPSLWSPSVNIVYLDWALHQTSLYLAFCGVVGWFIHRFALAVYWIGGDDMRYRWRYSIREYARIYPSHGQLRSLIDKLDAESKEWEGTHKYSFYRTVRMLVKKSEQKWEWADTWNSGLDVLLYVKNISPRLLDTIRLWFHIMHAQRAAGYSIFLGAAGAWFSFLMPGRGHLSLPKYFFGTFTVELGWTGMIVTSVILTLVTLMIWSLDRYLPHNVAQIDLSLILAGESDFLRHLSKLARLHPDA